MTTYSYSETVKAPPQEVWKLWENVAAWPKQDSSIVSASIEGPFEVGSKITIKPKGSPAVKVTLVKVEQNKGFESVGKLPLAKLRFVHKITTQGNKTTFRQSVIINGPLSGLFARGLGKSMDKNLQARVQKMAELINK